MLALAMIAALAACDIAEPAAVDLTFEWPAGTRPDFGDRRAYARGRLQVWPDGESAGARTLSEAGPSPLDRDGRAALAFEGLPLGEDRVVIVEIRGSTDENGAVLHYGVSRPFSLRAGHATAVTVRFPLAPGPGRRAGDVGDTQTDEGPGLSLRLLHKDGVVGRVPDPHVVLSLTATNADTVTVANGPALTVGAQTRRLADLRSLGDDAYEWPEPWDLNAGLDQTAADADGPRQVFLVATNAVGLRSELREATITLDRTPPVLDLLVAGTHFNAADAIRFTVNATEGLARQPDLRIERGDFQLRPEAREADGLSFTFTVPTTALPEDGPYTARVRGADVVENASAWTRGPAFEIDRTAPGLDGPVVVIEPALATDGARFARAGTRIELDIATTEPLDLDATSIFAGDVPLSAGEDGRWSATFAGDEAEGPAFLRGVLVDRAGNRAPLEALTDPPVGVHVDFTPPSLVGEPILERDDRRALARLAPDAVLARSDTSVTVGFSVSEPLREDPLIRLDGEQGPVATGQGQVFTVVVPPRAVEGATTVDFVARDRAGNAAAIRLGTIEYDLTPPPAPSVDAEDAIVFERAPWGSDASGGEPRFAVTGAAGATAEPGVVRIFDRADAARVELGSAPTGEDGSFPPVSLQAAGLTTVCVANEDRAGNLGPCAIVRDVTWVATMGRKVPGSSLANPATLVATGDLAPTPTQDPEVSAQPSAAALRDTVTSGGEPLVIEAALRWRATRRPTATPTPRIGAAVAYDLFRGRVVLFGGGSLLRGYDDTWAWDGAAWKELRPETVPPARAHAGMAYDARRDRAVVFGGRATEISDALGDTWELDGDQWLRRAPAQAPPARSYPAMTYDAARGVVVLFGGDGVEGPLNDTWEWDGDAWHERAADPSPAARYGASVAYDPDRRVTLLFGGATGSGSLADTWQWDGDAWAPVEPAGHAPPPSAGAPMVWDPARRRAVVLRGEVEPGEVVEVWEWDGADWSPRDDVLASPDGLHSARSAAAYDIVRGEVVLLGAWGNGAATVTWTLSGGAWLGRTAAWPHSRSGAELAYDEPRGRLLLHGGRSSALASGDAVDRDFTDTWAFDGRSWTELPRAGAPPFGAWSMTADREGVLLVGGRDDAFSVGDDCRAATWRLAAAGWAQAHPREAPPCLVERALAYHRARQRTVVASAHTVWEWAGADWLRTEVPEPSPLGSVRFAAGDALGQLVLVGARDDASAMARWDGATMTPLDGLPGGACADGDCAFDALRGRLVMFDSGVAAVDEGEAREERGEVRTWEWDGEQWGQITPSAAPPPLADVALTYDSRGRRVASFGGRSLLTESDTLWSWDGGALARPAVVWSIPWAAANAPEAEVRAARILVVAGGEGTTDEAPVQPVTGADLHLWDPAVGGWRAVLRHAAPPGQPEALSFDIGAGAALDGLLMGGARTLHCAITAAAPAGAGDTAQRLAVDRLEVRVRYRRPAIRD